MLFCDYYKKLKKAMGDAEFGKLPPDRGPKYQKIFMLMTLSVNDKSNGDYVKTYKALLKHLKKTFIKLKNDLENLKDRLQELKKEEKSLDKGEESLDSLKDRFIVYSTIKDENILHPKINADSFIKYNDILKGLPKESIKNFIKCIPFDNLIGSFKEILNKNPQSSLRDKVEASLNEDIDLLKSKFYNVCIDINNSHSLKQLLREKFYIEPFVNSFESYKDKNSTKAGRMANFIKILKEGRFYQNSSITDFKEIVDIIGDILKNTFIDIFTDILTDILNKNRTYIDILIDILNKNRILISRFIPEASSINGLVDVINKDINAIDFSELNKFVAKEEEYKKFEDLFNKNDIQMIHRYSKYLGFSLKNDFPDYSDISVREIEEYVNYLYFWLNKQKKDETFKKYCQGDSISKFAQEITPYLVSRPYFIDVINNLPDEQKKKVYKEFKAEITTVALDDSLDFLGEELSALLKKIIREADWEELWKKEKNNLLEMVFYPMLATLMCPRSYINPTEKWYKEEWYKDTYKSFHDRTKLRVYLRILEDNTIHIIKNHSHNFLVNLFFFIAEKERLFLGEIFDYLKLKPIPVEYVKTGSIERNFPKYDHGSPLITSIPLSLDAVNVQDLLGISPNKYVKEFFKYTRHTFNDVKHVLDFKKSIDDKDVYVQINVVPHIELGYMARFFKYYIKNEERILKAANQSRDFWITKRSSKLFTYIKKELKKELETYEIQNFQDFQDFQELKKYFLEKNDSPLILLWPFSFDELVDLHKKN